MTGRHLALKEQNPKCAVTGQRIGTASEVSGIFRLASTGPGTSMVDVLLTNLTF